jgi:hypothetical protein
MSREEVLTAIENWAYSYQADFCGDSDQQAQVQKELDEIKKDWIKQRK